MQVTNMSRHSGLLQVSLIYDFRREKNKVKYPSNESCQKGKLQYLYHVSSNNTRYNSKHNNV